MAATIASVRRGDVLGNLRFTVTNVTLDASYAAGGVPITPSQLGLMSVIAVDCNVTTPAGAVTSGDYDAVNSKLKLFTNAAELANGIGSGLVVKVFAYGY